MNVLLLDDHPLVLDALCKAVVALDGTVRPHGATTPQEAYRLLDEVGDFRLVLLDLRLGDDTDGFTVLDELRQRHPEVPVVIVSGTERLADVVRAVDMGAMGFLPKRTPLDDLYSALALVLSGGVYIPAVLLDLIVRMQGRGDLGETTISAAVAQLAAADAAALAGGAAQAAVPPGAASAASQALGLAAAPSPQGWAAPGLAAGAAPLPATGPGAAAEPGPAGPASLSALGLTPRQTDVMRLLLKALPNKLIARELNLSVETVKDHVAAVLRALGVSNRTQAVMVVSRMMQQPGGLGAGQADAPRR